MNLREIYAYRVTVAKALAEADIDLALANANPDLSSGDTGKEVAAQTHLDICKANVDAISYLAANIPVAEEEISDDGD